MEAMLAFHTGPRIAEPNPESCKGDGQYSDRCNHTISGKASGVHVMSCLGLMAEFISSAAFALPPPSKRSHGSRN